MFTLSRGEPTRCTVDPETSTTPQPLGEDEVRATKRNYGWPEDAKFLVPEGVREHFDAGIGRRGKELRECLRQSLAAMSPGAAEIFVLRYFDGYGNKEIARMLKKPQALIAVTLHRARRRLRKVQPATHVLPRFLDGLHARP